MKPAFTPGPWRECGRLVKAGKAKVVCEAPQFGMLAYKEDAANARLIAAAPDLYDALVWCREGVIDIDLIDRALAKANGETQ